MEAEGFAVLAAFVLRARMSVPSVPCVDEIAPQAQTRGAEALGFPESACQMGKRRMRETA